MFLNKLNGMLENLFIYFLKISFGTSQNEVEGQQFETKGYKICCVFLIRNADLLMFIYSS